MKRSLWAGAFLLLAQFLATGSLAVPVTFLVTPPADTPPAATVHLAGNFQNWRPGDENWQLARLADGRYSLTADFAPEQGLQFKFTLGSWLSVEKSAGGAEIDNRLYVVSEAATVEVTVAAWADGKPVVRPETITGHVETLSLPQFLDGRRVWVYLPVEYTEQPSRSFPVLYMFDGQNVFNDATSFVGEWQVDETLMTTVAAKRVSPMIVVAVDNGGADRAFEYTPWVDSHYGRTGGGAVHLQQWIDTLLPEINGRFRTLTGPEHTGLAGSSLGGLMSFYGGFAHPDVFGRIGAFSTTLRIAQGKLFTYCAEQPERPRFLYADMGSRETGNLEDRNHNGTDDNIEALRQMAGVLQQRGYLGGWDLMVVEDEGGLHNEQAWSRRFPAAIEFLFPAE